MPDNLKNQPISLLPGAASVLAIIFRFSAQSVWLDSDLEMKSHITKMCDSIAAYYGKSRLDLTMNDLHSLATTINKYANLGRVANIRFADAIGIFKKKVVLLKKILITLRASIDLQKLLFLVMRSHSHRNSWFRSRYLGLRGHQSHMRQA